MRLLRTFPMFISMAAWLDKECIRIGEPIGSAFVGQQGGYRQIDPPARSTAF
jgi:hypothetical protein